MDLRQLRHFAAVAQTLHFGRAADSLGMTQPPLSQSIMALERELGAALFVRTKRSVALTPLGAEWLAHVRAVLDGVAALPTVAKRLREGTAGRLAISFVSTADYSILPALVRCYASLFPEVEIALTEATSDVQIATLLEGKGHVGLVIPPTHAALPKPLSYLRLVTEPLVAAVPEGWVRQRRSPFAAARLSPAAVVAAPLILFPRQNAPAFHDLVTGYCAAPGADRPGSDPDADHHQPRLRRHGHRPRPRVASQPGAHRRQLPGAGRQGTGPGDRDRLALRRHHADDRAISSHRAGHEERRSRVGSALIDKRYLAGSRSSGPWARVAPPG